MPHKDLETRREWQKKDRAENPGKHAQRLRNWRSRNPDCRKQEFQRLKQKPDKYRKSIDAAIEYRRLLRDRLLELYGTECECCCESIKEFLTIDHIGGGGGEHRKQIVGIKFYNWLLSPGIPRAGFRILCFNCNFAIRFGDPCPHQLKGEFRKIRWITNTKYVVIKDYRTRYAGE